MLTLFFAAAIAWDAHCGAAARKVVASQPFESAAVSWSASATVRIRVSADGEKWSEWIAPAMDADSDRNLTAIGTSLKLRRHDDRCLSCGRNSHVYSLHR